MKAHVFITNKDTFPVVRDNGFWGVGIGGIPDTFEKVIKENLKNGKKPYFGIGLHEISYLKNFPLPKGERVEG